MKEKITAIIVILTFVLFCIFILTVNNKKEVLSVKTPTMAVIDLNGNRIEDDGETICIPELTSYTANLALYKDEIKGFPFEKGLALGYMADNFVHETLMGKSVKLKFNEEKTPQCRFAEIYTEGGKYSDILKNSGFAIKNGQFTDKEKSKKILQQAEKLKLIIFNHKSKKYHKLDCKYGKIAHDAVVLEIRDLPTEAKKCKFCHFNPKTIQKTLPQKVPDIISNGNIKIILTDFTQILKPDRQCRHEVCKELVNLVDSSKSTIDIALYGWVDIPKLKQAFINAQKRGVKLRVIYDTKTTKDNYYPETEDFIKLIQESRSDEIAGNSKLTNYLMHNKFMVFDNKTVYSGSMNFSLTGLSGFNQNNIIIINSQEIAKLYTNEFNQMFTGKFHTLKSKNNVKSYIMPDGTKITVYFSPQDKGITSAVVPIINNAQKYIFIPAFLITHKPLTNALILAKNRGIDVKIILDATSTGTRNSSIKQLRTAGIPVKIENYAGKMHSKVMIIDDKYVVTGSANFSNSGENKNDENQIIIENPKIAKFYKDFFLYLWAKIPDKYLKINPRPESKDSIGSCSDEVDNDYDGKIDTNDDGCR